MAQEKANPPDAAGVDSVAYQGGSQGYGNEKTQAGEVAMSIRLMKYEAARIALKEASAVDEVKDIRDKAQALAAYGRQAKNNDLIQWATEIKLRAERRCGELLAASPKNRGAAAPETNAVTSGDRVPPTLEEIGLSKKQSSDFQAIAVIPDEMFEDEIKKPNATTTGLVKKAKRAKEPGEPKEEKPRAPKPEKQEPNGELTKELEAADKQIRAQDELIKSLQSSDVAKELTKQHAKYVQLEGRLQLAVTQKNEAVKDATYAKGLLAKIRKALKVTQDSEILAALLQ